MKTPNDVAATARAWTALVEQIGVLGAIRDDDNLASAVALLDALLDASRGVEDSPLRSLLGLVGDLIESYETLNFGEPEASPADVLRELMAANQLLQADLARDLGGQSVVSAILSGRRTINARQASVLGRRFGLSPAVFIAKTPPIASADVSTPQVGLAITGSHVLIEVGASQQGHWVEQESYGAVSGVRWTARADQESPRVEGETGINRIFVDRPRLRRIQ